MPSPLDDAEEVTMLELMKRRTPKHPAKPALPEGGFSLWRMVTICCWLGTPAEEGVSKSLVMALTPVSHPLC
jgi:hypothetical protein